MKKLILLISILFILPSCKKDPTPTYSKETLAAKPFQGTWNFKHVLYESCKVNNKQLICKKTNEIPGIFCGNKTSAKGIMIIKTKTISFKSTLTIHKKKPTTLNFSWDCDYTSFKKEGLLFIKCKNKEFDKTFVVNLTKMKMVLVGSQQENNQTTRTTLTVVR